MAYIDFISGIHKATKRDYLARVLEGDKAEAAAISKQFGRDYFDGDRKYGYGGYRYDGRWLAFAQQIITHYKLKPGDRVLDIGCGKGFLVHDFRQVMPGLESFGIDISTYAIDNAMPEARDFVRVADAVMLPFPDQHFDLVVGINILHNLRLPDLSRALKEIMRVGRKNKFVVNDSYRTEREKVNLMYWQLTCECFFTPEEWQWVFDTCGYDGDYDCVCFE